MISKSGRTPETRWQIAVGFVYLFSKQPIAGGEALKKAKMWLWEGDALAEAFYKEAGVVPVPLAVTDVMTSLQTNLIDAVYCSPLACLALQWFTRVQYFRAHVQYLIRR